MNSEELEQSLRTEFESYLKTVVADMRQEVSDFQKMVESEFEKHKSQMDDAFRSFNDRFASDKNLDEAFTESVVEHLRLARDEGARITATAIAEAEELQKEQAVAVDTSHLVGEIRDAIRDISSKNTQSAILRALVSHATNFTPRGAFFIIKNEHLVGWRVFGKETSSDDKAVREVFFPTASDTLLGMAIQQLDTVEGTFSSHTDNSVFLSRLSFGQPDRMYAIPLVVRERAVAVLYADYGTEGSSLNIEALESLVQVAGLTVEISASARSARTPQETETTSTDLGSDYQTQGSFPAPASFTDAAVGLESSFGSEPQFDAPTAETFESSYTYSEEALAPTANESVADDDDAYSISEPVETTDSFSFSATDETVDEAPEFETSPSFDYAPTYEEPVAEFETTSTWNASEEVSDEYSSVEYESFEKPSDEEAADFSTTMSVPEYEFEAASTASNVEFEQTAPSFEAPVFESVTPSFEVESYEPVEAAEVEAVVAPMPVRPRLSERNVDLPIEVSEDERRLHNDARRFARLLVSEIKLYNEQKVKEGRDSSDLYDKLREAIDRSREMYDKRVQPPVAAKFDYFHYELVSNLAEGDETKLGATYPGAGV